MSRNDSEDESESASLEVPQLSPQSQSLEMTVLTSVPQSMPHDIAQCPDDKPIQPNLKSFPKTMIGDRNRSFSRHWYQS